MLLLLSLMPNNINIYIIYWLYELFMKIIIKKLTTKFDHHQRNEQAEFHKDIRQPPHNENPRKCTISLAGFHIHRLQKSL